MDEIRLDKEEKEILDSFENDEWKRVEKFAAEVKKHQEYARETIKKNKRINIRISSKDLDEIQTLAIENGIPYQTLISSILHRYVHGNLVDKQRINKTAIS